MSRQTILVIEDEDDLREVITYNLQREWFEVLATGSGCEGLNKARVRAPHVVLALDGEVEVEASATGGSLFRVRLQKPRETVTEA